MRAHAKSGYTIASVVGCRKGLVVLGVVLATVLIAAPAAAAETSAPDSVGGDPAAEAEAAIVPEAAEAGAASRDEQTTEPENASIEPRVKGLRGGKVTVGRRAKLVGTLRPFVPGERVTIRVLRNGKRIKSATRRVVRGKFKLRKKVTRPGRYWFKVIHPRSEEQRHAVARSRKFRVRYPSLRKGDRTLAVKVLNRLLKRQGYVTGSGRKFGSRTADAVLAFRKVNGMSWRSKVNTKVFKKLARGKGAFKVKKPNAGGHVEVDISRQAMALIKKGRAVRTYHVSTGAPATPTIRGKYRFYRKDPGYNSIGMYYSGYFIRGYAIHGYKSVPKYPASHGCVRVAIREAKSIYRWIDIGMPIYTYN